ncbi:S-malonyl transacylase [Babesia caballi]|uniref:S-malonyl transacylase n=1 Tax=Babesia caballi TaxID=5871 RepID=A0AAV4M662_BABCB|nr:S-malonyl transacylase [Babesia caballi]
MAAQTPKLPRTGPVSDDEGSVERTVEPIVELLQLQQLRLWCGHPPGGGVGPHPPSGRLRRDEDQLAALRDVGDGVVLPGVGVEPSPGFVGEEQLASAVGLERGRAVHPALEGALQAEEPVAEEGVRRVVHARQKGRVAVRRRLPALVGLVGEAEDGAGKVEPAAAAGGVAVERGKVAAAEGALAVESVGHDLGEVGDLAAAGGDLQVGGGRQAADVHADDAAEAVEDLGHFLAEDVQEPARGGEGADEGVFGQGGAPDAHPVGRAALAAGGIASEAAQHAGAVDADDVQYSGLGESERAENRADFPGLLRVALTCDVPRVAPVAEGVGAAATLGRGLFL